MFLLSDFISFFYNILLCGIYFRLAVTGWKLLLCVRNFGLSRIWTVDLKKKYGSWAIVTGCTDGIGKAYTYELAKRGINVILISRSLKKLEDVAADLRSKYNTETEILQIDFSSKEDIYDKIKNRIHGREIGILVNNVGVSYVSVKPFDQVTDKEIDLHISVNIAALTYLTKIVVPSMIEKGRGAIVNLSSIAACKPHPYLAVYSASKAYNSYFSSCLGSELENLTVQALTPYFIITNMVADEEFLRKPTVAFPSPETYAASAISTLGYTNDTCGYLIHEFVKIIFLENLPLSLVSWITAKGCKLYYESKKKKSL